MAWYHISEVAVEVGRNRSALEGVELVAQEVEYTWVFEVEPCMDQVEDDLAVTVWEELAVAVQHKVEVEYARHLKGKQEGVEGGRELHVNEVRRPDKSK